MKCNYCGREFGEGQGGVSFSLEGEKVGQWCSTRCFCLACKRVKRVLREMYPSPKRGNKKSKGKANDKKADAKSGRGVQIQHGVEGEESGARLLGSR
jgi:hypothetical protein